MSWTRLGRSERVAAALHRIGRRVDEPRQGFWLVSPPRLRRRIRVELTTHWLSLALPMRAAAPSAKRTHRMLRRNAALGVGQRIVARGPAVERSIDLPIEALRWEEAEPLEAVLAAGLAEIAGTRKHDQRIVAAEDVAMAEAHRQRLSDWLEAATWPARQPDALEAPLEVPLEVPGASVAARVAAGPDLASLSVAIPEPGSGANRPAVETLVFAAASSKRMVKPLLEGEQLRLEVGLHQGLDAVSALAVACEALSTTLQACWDEAELLAADARLAEIYMESFFAAA